MTLDLHTREGQELFRGLCRHADVLITNFRPPRLEEWDIDYDRLSAANSTLIMLHLSAFGRTGPYRDRPGFARVIEGFAGLAHITGYPDRPPVLTGYPVVDGIGGLYGAFTVMLAIEQRNRTGEGQLIDLALYEPLLRIMEDFVVWYDTDSHVKVRAGNAHAHAAPNDVYPTQDDGYVVIPASTQNMWERLADVMGLEDDDRERYATNVDRMQRRHELHEQMVRFTSSMTTDRLLTILDDAGVACGKFNDIEDIVADPQVRARGNLRRYRDGQHPDGVLMQAPVPTFSSIQGEVHSLGPRLGADNAEVFGSWLGLTADDLNRLRANDVI